MLATVVYMLKVIVPPPQYINRVFRVWVVVPVAEIVLVFMKVIIAPIMVEPAQLLLDIEQVKEQQWP